MRESSSDKIIIGVDEAGRGPWAGPVVAASVIYHPCLETLGINDSKKLSPKKRQRIYDELKLVVTYGVGIASTDDIDSLNILQATFLAMKRSVEQLPTTPEDVHILVDGNRLPKWEYSSESIVGGDGLYLSIGAASIIAKQTRDAMMEEYDRHYPGYGFAQHKGYGTKQHQEALAHLGATDIHRKSFAPIQTLLRHGCGE